MDLASLVQTVLQASIAMTVVALGIHAKLSDIVAFATAPRQIARSLLAINLIMPVVAVVIVKSFDLDPPVKLALVALALSPIPPMLPKKQLSAGGSSGYVFGLLLIVAVSAILYVPIAIEAIERVFGIPLQMSPIQVGKIVLTTVLVPLGIGLAIGAFAPRLGDRIANPLSKTGMVLLSLGSILILIKFWPAMASLIGNGTLLAFVAFVVVGLAVGHFQGGPNVSDRGTLAFATATRHPGVALALASVNFPDQKLALPAVLLYMIVSILLSIPYMKWLGKMGGQGEQA